jgi:hypothetical protein
LADAVLADPKSKLPRLALADDLIRRGDPFGSELRNLLTSMNIHFQPERIKALGARWLEWVGEVDELAWHWDGSADPNHRSPHAYTVVNGFVEEVHLRGETLVRDGEALLATWPLRKLLAEGGAGVVKAQQLPMPSFGKLDILGLTNMALEDDDAMWLANRPELAGLLELDLGHNRMGEQGIEALYASPHLSRVQLNLNGNSINLYEDFSDYNWSGGSSTEVQWSAFLKRLVATHGMRPWVPAEGVSQQGFRP